MSVISDSPILIRDDKIAFSLNIAKYNSNFYRVSVVQMLTRFGFLVPMNTSSMDFLDYFEDGTLGLQSGERHCKAILIDHRARVYELAMTVPESGEPIVSKLRVPAGPGMKYAKSSVRSEEEKAMVALDITPTLEEAVKVLTPNLYVAHSEYTILSIESIAEGLRKAECTKPFPVNRIVSKQALSVWASTALLDVPKE